MRVSSKVALSSGLLTAILIAVLGYSLAEVRRLAGGAKRHGIRRIGIWRIIRPIPNRPA